MEHEYTMKEYYKKLKNLQARIEQHQKRLATMAETVTRLEKLCEWISVDDRLPECGNPKAINEKWLVVDSIGRRYITNIHPGNWNKDIYGDFTDVTHWMPLPDLPKKKE